jgi:hypothetical protein
VPDVRKLLASAKAMKVLVDAELGPPAEGTASPGEQVVLRSLVRGTRSYIERVANQANGAYEMGWYDACAVMIRRLLETLIIEAFEKAKLAAKIQNSGGDFVYLRDLIDACMNEPSWNLSRNCKAAMPRLKDIGDKSAHSRRYNAHKGDVQPLLGDVRVVVQELLSLSGLK